MADYNSTYTGAEVDASVAKSQALPSATDINEAVAPASASAGDVWTADGNGGAAWVAPSGGDGLYLHKISIQCNSASDLHKIYMNFYSSASEAFTSLDALIASQGGSGATSAHPFWGRYTTGGSTFYMIYSISSNSISYYSSISDISSYNFSVFSFTDAVHAV